MYYTTIQLSQLNVPQYRERLWCFPIRKDAADAIGGIPLPKPKATESPRIGDFIKLNSNYYNTIGPATMIERDNDQVHHEFKPHLKGEITIEEPDGGKIRHSVWGELGLSPCIRTANRIFIELGEHVVEITIDGLAALQGIPLTDLPGDIDEARRAIGNAINRTMHEYAMTMGLLYLNRYLVDEKGKRDEQESTTTAIDEQEEEEAPAPFRPDPQHIEPTGGAKDGDGPWRAEESGEVATHLRRQPTNSIQSSNGPRLEEQLLPTGVSMASILLPPHQREYEQLLRRLNAIKEVEEQAATTVGVKSAATVVAERTAAAITARTASAMAKQAAELATTAAKVARPTKPVWTCFHSLDPRADTQARLNIKNATARATAQKKKKSDEQGHINKIGEHYQAEFKRIAKEKGVSDAKLKELDYLHQKEGSQEKLLHALQTLMVGDDLECISVAEEIAQQVGLNTALFEEMTVYASNNSIDFESVCVASVEEAASTAHSETWKATPHWEPAKNITEQLERPDGEGMETFRCAK
jgi:hypothetical protein